MALIIVFLAAAAWLFVALLTFALCRAAAQGDEITARLHVALAAQKRTLDQPRLRMVRRA
jgi:hypothetical protein